MPLTFPSHAAAVIPLKMWRPAWFDGVALVVGSAAPDIPYVLGGYTGDVFRGARMYVDAHTIAALFWFCIPVAIVGTVIIRRAAPIVAAHLPDLGTWHMHDYGVLGAAKYRWWVTLLCAWFGALTHIFWDSFTHPRASFWSSRFDDVAFAGHPWWEVLQQASTIGGAIAVVLMAREIGRRRMLLRNRTIEDQPIHRYAFWSATVATWLVGLAVQPLLAEWKNMAVLGVRILFVIALGFLAGAAAVAAVAFRNGRRGCNLDREATVSGRPGRDDRAVPH